MSCSLSSVLVGVCGHIYLGLCMCVCVLEGRERFRVMGERGLKEVSSCPLVTLELVTAHFLLFSPFCPPT